MVSTLMPCSSSTGTATMNGSETMTAFASIMLDDVHRVLGPDHEVGARSGLVKHRQAGAAHPQALSGRRDLDGEAGQHADGVAVADTRGGEATRDPAGALVHLTPGVTDGFVRFTGDHARSGVTGVAVHLLGESAHDSLLGSTANAKV